MSEQRDIVERLRQRPSVLSKIRPMFDEAADEIASLRAQLADAEATMLKLNSGEELQSLMKLNNELLAQLASARKALEEYGQHTVHCDYDRPSDPKCTCGFDEALAQTDEKGETK